MLPLQAIESEIPGLNRSWLSMAQRSVRADVGRASEFGLSVAQANKVDTLSATDLQVVASTWRTPLFVPRSMMVLEGALEAAFDSNVCEMSVGLTQERIFFLAYLQTVSGFCRIDHSSAGERFWLPTTVTRRLRDATTAELSSVAASRAAGTVVRCASLLERMINFVTSSPAMGSIRPQKLVIMGLASLLSEDNIRVA
ncbi:MAG: hypothetical protein DDT34_01292 [Firmicutes bacterium]|nr:hypothetical protein [Bacillota bacterium]